MVTIPFRRKKGRSQVQRTLSIEKREVDETGKEVNTWFEDFDINLTINWQEEDARDVGILSGQERKQNIIVDARKLLLALQEMYPELDIKFESEGV